MDAVNEMKFACPVCRQHIQCGADCSGQIISCPSCFRNIIVPQAPSGQPGKLILRAVQAPAKRVNQAVKEVVLPRKAYGLAGATTAMMLLVKRFF